MEAVRTLLFFHAETFDIAIAVFTGEFLARFLGHRIVRLAHIAAGVPETTE